MIKIKLLVNVFALLAGSIPLLAQHHFVRNTQLDVYKMDSALYKNAWVGGLNHVQFSEVDLNLDGTNDLVVFDRSGHRLSTFINNGILGTIDYTYAPEYLDSLPEFKYWVLFRDYNCDGKQDIFAYSTGGMAIYKNTSQTSLSFELITPLLESDYNPDDTINNPINLYVSSTDIPAIDDIDGDGDLDVLTFSILGTYVEYHKNLSIELHGSCDSLNYILTNKCWGYFAENLSNNSVTLYDTCNSNVLNPEKIMEINHTIDRSDEAKKHSGSTLLTMDVDSNGTKDLLLGDISFNNLTLLYNSDQTIDLTASSMTTEDQNFPSNNTSTIAVDLEIFPAGFYIDVNNDQVKDLIVTTNCNSGCENYKSTWLYLNNRSNNLPDFNFQQDNFLQDEMIEVGEGTHPVFFDYNDDGLMDLIIGNYGRFDNSLTNLYSSYLSLYKNVGTTSTPVFKLVDNDFAGISTMNLDLISGTPTLGIHPSFGDLDNDGDQDMLLGDYSGNIHYFMNTAGAGNEANFVLNQVKYQSIDVGSFAAPQLIDLNRDGKLDLVIGKNNGYFTYYENTGTVSAPFYTKMTDSLGYVSTLEYGYSQGNSVPHIYDEAGAYKMIAGSLSGHLFTFDDIDGNLSGNFNKTDSTFLNIDEGKNSSPTLSDLNNDGHLDLIIGNYAGGLVYYEGDEPIIAVKEHDGVLKGIHVYPNPVKELLTLDIGRNAWTESKVIIVDVLGNIVLTQDVNKAKLTVGLSGIPQGVYLLKFTNFKGTFVQKFIKQ